MAIYLTIHHCQQAKESVLKRVALSIVKHAFQVLNAHHVFMVMDWIQFDKTIIVLSNLVVPTVMYACLQPNVPSALNFINLI